MSPHRTSRGGLALAAVAFAVPLAVAACAEKGGAAGGGSGGPGAGSASAAPAVSVGVMTLAKRDLPLTIEAVASLDGYVNADIRARVRGYLRSQEYKDGSFVKTGQTLFMIDPSEYTVASSAAKASVSRAQTAQSRAKIELERDVGLFKTGNLSQQDLDNAKAALADAEAQVRAAQAQLDQANLNLGYTQVKSPIDGIAGIAQVRVGNLVGQDQATLLATVSQTDPMRVTFPLSEVDYVRYPERFKDLEKRDLAWAKAETARLDADKNAKSSAAVELVLSDGSTFKHRGVIVSVNRNIDPTTGTIQLQALVPNPEALLRPGQYGRVRLPRGNEGSGVLSVPEKALVSVQGTYSLAVVGPDNKVALKHVELGASVQGQRVVVSGVAEGDRIVVDGTQRVTDGTTIDPHPASSAAAPASATAAGAPSASAPPGATTAAQATSH